MAVFEDDYTALNYKAVTPRLRKQSKSCFTSPASSYHPALFQMVVVSILPQAEFGPNDHFQLMINTKTLYLTPIQKVKGLLFIVIIRFMNDSKIRQWERNWTI